MDTLHVQRTRSNEKGFTLVELLVVIVIIGILAAVAVFAVGGIADRGNESACEASSNSLRTAVEAFRADDTEGDLPTGLDELEPAFIQLDDTDWAGGAANTFNVGGDAITYHPADVAATATTPARSAGDVSDACGT